MPTRREILAAAAALSLAPRAAFARRKRRRRLLPRVNGGINVQPLRRFDEVNDFTPPLIVPELVLLQLRALYELGFESMRMTLSFNGFGPDFFAAIPYVRAARALGIHVLGILGQFGHGFDLYRALADPARRPRVLDAYLRIFATPVQPASKRLQEPGGISLQVLNEPAESRGIHPGDYVLRFLAPTYAELKRMRPDLEVVSAASVGRRAGLLRLRTMLAYGLEGVCDTVGVHVYDDRLIDDLRGLLSLPAAVTESGAHGTANHLPWVTGVFPRIREALVPLRGIYYFDLFDGEPDGFRLMAIEQRPDGSFVSRYESTDLVAYLQERVRGAAGPGRYATFEELVPSLDPYLPTAEDFAIAEAAR